MGYRNPTLTEIFAEVYLEADSLTEAKFFEVVPQLQELGFTEVEFSPGGLSLDFRPGRMGSPREKQLVRCWKPGRQELAQVGEDLFVVNLMGSYPGWARFLTLFEKGIGALNRGLGVARIRSLSLRTIDRFEIPRDGFVVSDYLNTSGQVIPKWYENCRESLDLTMGRGFLDSDGRNRLVNVAVRANVDPVVLAIQASFHDVVSSASQLSNVLERLHGESNQTFESLITNRTRSEVMGGVVS